MRSPREWTILALTLVAPAVAVMALLITGALLPPPVPGLSDPGQGTWIALPISRAVRDISAALTIGSLALTSTVLPPTSHDRADRVEGVRRHMLNVAGAAGSVWVWSGMVVVVITYADLMGTNPLAPGGLEYFSFFLTNVDVGRAMLFSTSLAAVAAIGSLFIRTLTGSGVLALVAIVALWPLATTGHAAGAADHDVAVNAQMAHLLGIALWAGGLAALLLVGRRLDRDDVPVVTQRYSRLAGVSVAAVAASGITAAMLRLPTWSALTSTYGTLIVLKGMALGLLVLAGAWHRRRIIPAMSRLGTGNAFTRLAVAELTIMAAAAGLGVALSRTPPPTGSETTSSATALLGYPMPPALNVYTFATQWRLDSLWAPMAVAAVTLYLIGVRRMRRRGDGWPWARTVAWVVGWTLMLWATSASPGVYGEVLFSMHMVQHMTIATAVPAFLVLAAPVTLALRTLRPRRDGSRGAKEWLVCVIHSPVLRFFGHPIVAAAVFVVSLVVFYSSTLFELSLRSHTMHLLMVLHFLLAGYLLAYAICGIDPGPRRTAYPFRMLVLMMTFGFHALFSVSLMSRTDVLAESWYRALGRSWGPSSADDQYAGATLGWLLGDYPIAILGFALIWAWVRSDRRDSERYDRRALRDDDAQLRQYNDALRRMNDRT